MTRCIFLVSMLVAPAVALAQNKCVDAKGKVTYQEAPCPGSVKPPPRPAPAAPSSGPAVQPRAEGSLHREIGELQRCKGDWEAVADSLQTSRAQVAKLRAEGDADEATREQDVSRRYLEESMERFLPVCSPHGFAYPRDAEGEKRNAAAAAAIGQKLEPLRAKADALAKQADEARGAAGQLEEEREKVRVARARQCVDMLRQMGEARAGLRMLDGDRRVASEKAIAENQAAYDKGCRGE